MGTRISDRLDLDLVLAFQGYVDFSFDQLPEQSYVRREPATSAELLVFGLMVITARPVLPTGISQGINEPATRRSPCSGFVDFAAGCVKLTRRKRKSPR
jgi:hypothetical protein